ncbi:MAG: histidinol dehydrogenase [Hyphomonadaceae bacterium]
MSPGPTTCCLRPARRVLRPVCISEPDFMKRTSVQRISEAGFRHLAEAAETLAACEGLPAHGLSVRMRRGGEA